MKNRGSTPILTKFEANPCSGLREVVEKLKKTKKVYIHDFHLIYVADQH